MTTIIIIVVVALVFFVTICVVTFMVWKREAEMRTDSIKAIENNLEEMLFELSGDQAAAVKNRARKNNSPYDGVLQDMQNMQQEIGDKIKQESDSKAIKKKKYDPFGWVRGDRTDPEEDEPKDLAPDMDAAEQERLYIKTDSETVWEEPAVVKTEEKRPRRLKWVEVYEEPEEEKEPEVAQAPEEEYSEKLQDVELADHEALEPAKIDTLVSAEDTASEPAEPFIEDVSLQDEASRGEIHFDEAPMSYTFEEISQELSRWATGEEDYGPEEMREQNAEHDSDDNVQKDFYEPFDSLVSDHNAFSAEDFSNLTGRKDYDAEKTLADDSMDSMEEDDFLMELMNMPVEELTEEPEASEETDFLEWDQADSGDVESVEMHDAMEIDEAPVDETTEEDEALFEIDLDAIENIRDTNLDEIGMLDDEYEFDRASKSPTGYNVGKSGKEYTVSELEALIKE